LAIPVLIILVSGILLQVKKQSAWVQPPEQRGKGSIPTIGFDTMLQSIRQQEDLAISGWDDVHRIDIRPSKGMAKVTLKSGWEVQVDLEDGSILQTAIRRSDWIESIHDGSFFWGDATKLGIFLPSAIGLTVLWITGLWMFWLPISVKRKRKARAAAATTTSALVIWLLMGHSIGLGEDWERPNIVFILADDLGWGELGCYGQEKLQTPNIDRLAREGTRFTQHYSGAPVCAPSRCVLMTGKHLGHAEIRGNLQASRRFPEFAEGQYPLSENAVTFVSRLKEAGYATGAFGKWGLGPVGSTGDPNTKGFDEFFGYNCQAVAHSYYPSHLWRNRDRILLNAQPISGHPKGATGNEPAEQWRGEAYAPYRMIEEAEAFVERHAEQPFFLYLPFIEPHVAMHPPQESIDRFPESWDTQPYRGGNGYIPHPRPRAAYAAMIHDLDSYVGRILDALQRHKLSERTLVIFTSDNGTTHPSPKEKDFHVGGVDATFFRSTANLRGFKGSVYEGGIRVPMIARLPGRIPAGVVNDTPSYFADWFPTLCEFANIEVPTGMDGVSLRSVLLGERTYLEERPPMVWVFPEYGGQVAVRWGSNKLVRRSLATKQPGPWELYDLASDPGETKNLAENDLETVSTGRTILLQQMADNPLFPVKVD
jgi:arylsulfatase A-like enzyme